MEPREHTKIGKRAKKLIVTYGALALAAGKWAYDVYMSSRGPGHS